LLSLLIPLVVYNLVLKASDIASRPGDHDFFRTLDLMRSDMFFVLGYVMLWIGLFAAVRGRITHRIMVFPFHVATILVVLVSTCAHQYFQETGTTLDYGIIALWLPQLKEAAPVLTQGVPPSAWVLLGAALFYVIFGPLIISRLIEWWGGRSERSLAGTPEGSFVNFLGLFLLALGFGSLSMLIDVSSADASKSFARDPVVNVVLTGFEEVSSEADAGDSGPAVENPAADASLAPSLQTQKRNVVLIHLESTRAQSVTPYNQGIDTTPFLNELAKNSLVAERDYTTVPHTSKASVSVNCGIEPHLVQTVTEAEPGGVPAPCLPSLLKTQGYSTVFFQSSTQDFENFNGLVKTFGYDEYYPLESMSTDGFERSNYFGYEDDIMLKPSQEWLKMRGNKPFMAEYLMGTGHHDYECLGLRYGDENFSNKEPLNSYLNCLRYQDHFVQNLFDQYKKLGLYNNTIFVLYGDHGEGFGEHGLNQHDDTIYEEGLKVPLIIHAPGITDTGGRTQGLSNHTDILPTVLEMLGYEVKDGEYPGYSLLHPLPGDRTLDVSCWHDKACMASIQGYEKYIYHYGDQPDEIFDLSKDPHEEHDLAGEYSKEELDKRREALLAWRSSVNAGY
jgi:phosphoglycerol transferase MdoB-like AlkP superfamily enzyme